MRKYIHKNEFVSIKHILDEINNSIYHKIKYDMFSEDNLFQNQFLYLKENITSSKELEDILRSSISEVQAIKEIVDLFKLKTDLEIPEDLYNRFKDKKVVLFIGSGVSANAGYPGWKYFAKSAMKKLRDQNKINFQTYNELIESNTDPKQLLSIFEGVFEKSSEVYKEFYTKAFEPRNDETQKKSKKLFDLITNDVFGNKIITTNIDDEIYHSFTRKLNNFPTQDHQNPSQTQKIQREIIKVADPEEIRTFQFNDDKNQVIHIHGTYQHPEKTVFTLNDYSNAYFNKTSPIVEFLEYVFREYTVLFIGYGLSEFAILESVIKFGNNNYSLEPIFFNQIEPLLLKTKAFKNLNINIIPYYRDSNDYFRLKDVLQSWKNKIINQDFLDENYKLKQAIESNEIEKYEEYVISSMKRDCSHREYFFRNTKNENWIFILQSAGFFSIKNYPISSYNKGFEQDSMWYQLIYIENLLIKKTISAPIKSLIIEIISDILNSDYTNDWIDSMISRILGNLPQNNIKIEVLKVHLQKIEDNPYEKQKTEFWTIKKLFYNILESNDHEKIKQISDHLFSFILNENEQRNRIMRYDSYSFIHEFQDDKFSSNITSESIKTVLDKNIDILRNEGKTYMFISPIPIQIDDKEYEVKVDLSNLELLSVIVQSGEKTIISFSIVEFYKKTIDDLEKLFKQKFTESNLDYTTIETTVLSDQVKSFREVLKFLYQENYEIFDINLLSDKDSYNENDYKNLVLIIVELLEKLRTSDRIEFKSQIQSFFENQYYFFPIFRKIGLFFIIKYFKELKSVFWNNISKYHFLDNYKYNDLTYEILTKNSTLITPAKAEILSLLIETGPKTYDIEKEKGRFKYWQLKWYSVLKDDPKYVEKYNFLVRNNEGKEYSHKHSGIVYTSSPKSPISPASMAEMSALEIYHFLISYKSESTGFNSPDEWGLSSVLKKDSYDNLYKYLDNIKLFEDVDYKYLSSITSSIISKMDNTYSDYIEMLIEFYSDIFQSSLQEHTKKEKRITNKESIASEVFELFTKIVKNDTIKISTNNIFTKIVELANNVYQYVPTQTYENYVTQDGFVTYVLNNPEAKYFNLIFQLSLREGRQFKNLNDKWRYKHIFNNGLDRNLDSVYTLLGLNLDNFKWLNIEWVKEKISEIKIDSKEWTAFIGGYFPRGPIIEESVFSLLKPTYEFAIKYNMEPKDYGGFGISGHIANLYATEYIPLIDGDLIDLFIINKPKKIPSILFFFTKNKEYFEKQNESEKRKIYILLNNLVNFILERNETIEKEIKQQIFSSALNLITVFKVLSKDIPNCLFNLSRNPLPLVHRNFSILENNFDSFNKSKYAHLLLEISLKMTNIRIFRFDGSDIINIWNFIRENMDLSNRKDEILELCEKYIRDSVPELIDYFQEFAQELKNM
jgi:NAD-dependent SIR2 family protein deacetylase